MLKITVKDRPELGLEVAKQGYSIRAFSKKIGVSPSFLSQIINGNSNPSPVVAKKIADGLGYETTKFFLYQMYASAQIGNNNSEVG